MRNGSMVLAGLFTVAALVGCGSSSSGGGGGGFSTSVPSGTKLSSLTTAQAAQLCTDLTTYESTQAAAQTTDGCKIAGIDAAFAAQTGSTATLTDAQLQADCTVGTSTCTSADAGSGGQALCDSTTFAGEPTTCTSAVSDVQKCISDMNTANSTFYAALPSCSALTAASLASAEAAINGDGGNSGGPPEPASCTTIEAMGCVGNTPSGFVGRQTGGRRNK
jgi:hypothetical protein